MRSMFTRSFVIVGILVNAAIGSLCISPTADAASLGALHEGHAGTATRTSYAFSHEHDGIKNASDRSDRTQERTCCEGHFLSPLPSATASVSTRVFHCPALLPVSTVRLVERTEGRDGQMKADAPPASPPSTRTVVLLR